MVVVEMRSHMVFEQQGAHMVEAWLPGEVRMVPPVRVIGVSIWGIG